jgi:hypothetical protein
MLDVQMRIAQEEKLTNEENSNLEELFKSTVVKCSEQVIKDKGALNRNMFADVLETVQKELNVTASPIVRGVLLKGLKESFDKLFSEVDEINAVLLNVFLHHDAAFPSEIKDAVFPQTQTSDEQGNNAQDDGTLSEPVSQQNLAEPKRRGLCTLL